ncbi:uncharacterized protein LOC119178475 isoform X3 [Rhipicephalus microplus]|uniref:uncharacterized protein LOC119178475 isoform X3 n=1 Tax=Rhipicephalus microplus TaxID=6941 RepID=UPI003F6D0610
MGLDMVRTSCPRVGKVSLDRVRSSLHVVRMRDFAPGNVRADNISSVTFSHECYIQNSRKDAGGLGTAQQRLHTSEQPPCYPDYKARRGNGPTKRTVMFCCFYGWESLKKDDDPALYDKGGYRWRLYGRKAHGEAATPCYKFASCFPRRLKIPKSKMKLQRQGSLLSAYKLWTGQVLYAPVTKRNP